MWIPFLDHNSYLAMCPVFGVHYSPSPSTSPTPLPRGFYSRLLSPSDLADLVSASPSGLSAEIELMRVFIRRLVEQSSQVSSLAELQKFTRALSDANSSLDRLIKTQEKYFSAGSEVAQALNAAFDQLTQEGFFDPARSSFSPRNENNE